jgi:HSP20 family molecular chaperone IbpA
MSLLPGNFYLDDLFDAFSPITRMPKMDLMRCDIYEKDGRVHIEMDVPGYDKSNINVDVEDGILTIEAKTSNETVDEGKNYYRKERISGSFKRQFNVGAIDEDEIKAKFNIGVLEVSFPKEEKKETKRKIDIY